jgi:hypothetical protein
LYAGRVNSTGKSLCATGGIKGQQKGQKAQKAKGERRKAKGERRKAKMLSWFYKYFNCEKILQSSAIISNFQIIF